MLVRNHSRGYHQTVFPSAANSNNNNHSNPIDSLVEIDLMKAQ